MDRLMQQHQDQHEGPPPQSRSWFKSRATSSGESSQASSSVAPTGSASCSSEEDPAKMLFGLPDFEHPCEIDARSIESGSLHKKQPVRRGRKKSSKPPQQQHNREIEIPASISIVSPKKDQGRKKFNNDAGTDLNDVCAQMQEDAELDLDDIFDIAKSVDGARSGTTKKRSPNSPKRKKAAGCLPYTHNLEQNNNNARTSTTSTSDKPSSNSGEEEALEEQERAMIALAMERSMHDIASLDSSAHLHGSFSSRSATGPGSSFDDYAPPPVVMTTSTSRARPGLGGRKDSFRTGSGPPSSTCRRPGLGGRAESFRRNRPGVGGRTNSFRNTGAARPPHVPPPIPATCREQESSEIFISSSLDQLPGPPPDTTAANSIDTVRRHGESEAERLERIEQEMLQMALEQSKVDFNASIRLHS